MKKNLIAKVWVIILLIFAGLLMIGCEGFPWGGNDPEDPEKNYYTVTITVISEEGGTVSPSGEITMLAGWDKVIVANPDPGYKVMFYVDGVLVTLNDNGSYVINDIDQNHDIDVEFEKTPLYDLIQNLTSGPWTLTSWIISGYMIGRGDYYHESDFAAGDSVFVHTATFDIQNWVKSYTLEGNLKWDYPYELTEDSLFVAGRDSGYKIVELTEDRMVLKSLMGYGDETGQLGYLDFVEVWEHKN